MDVEVPEKQAGSGPGDDAVRSAEAPGIIQNFVLCSNIYESHLIIV